MPLTRRHKLSNLGIEIHFIDTGPNALQIIIIQQVMLLILSQQKSQIHLMTQHTQPTALQKIIGNLQTIGKLETGDVDWKYEGR